MPLESRGPVRDALKTADDRLAEIRGDLGLPTLNSVTWLRLPLSKDARERIRTEFPKAIHLAADLLPGNTTENIPPELRGVVDRATDAFLTRPRALEALED